MPRRGNTINTAFRDVLLSANLLISCLLILILPNINPPSPKENGIKSPGPMSITAAWAAGMEDVDVWVKSPDDNKAVGYSRQNGKTFNLLRDDIGGDASDPFNFENIFSTALPEGEYVVNLHCYRCTAPQEVTVEIRIGGDNPHVLFSQKVTVAPGREITVIRFKLDANGQLVADSQNKVFTPLRSAR